MVSNDAFFQRPQAAAVLKHGILVRYTLVFAAMAGARTGRVVYFDGYAGPGRYDDGAPGSPLLAVRSARKSAKWGRSVECLFAEKKPAHAENLRSVLASEAPEDLAYTVWEGDVERHVDSVIAKAGSDPLLAFLDPFGAGLSYEALTGKLLNRPPAHPTEVLLNLNLEMVRRIGGLLARPKPSPGDERTLGGLDQFFGGSWWRDEFRSRHEPGVDGSAASAADHVAREFVARVATLTGFSSFAVPVRRRPGHHPLFLLLLFTRYWAAPWKFNEQVSLANADWRLACFEQDTDLLVADLAEDQPTLFGDNTETWLRESESTTWKQQQARLEGEWVDNIASNLDSLLSVHPTARMGDWTSAVFGQTLGLARDMHVKRAWDQLAGAGGVAPRDRSVRRLEQSWMRRVS